MSVEAFVEAPQNDDVLALAQAAIDATQQLDAALAASNAASDAHAAADHACEQKLTDLGNALDASGISAPEFVFGGYRFTRGVGNMRVVPLPPALGDLGGAP